MRTDQGARAETSISGLIAPWNKLCIGYTLGPMNHMAIRPCIFEDLA